MILTAEDCAAPHNCPSGGSFRSARCFRDTGGTASPGWDSSVSVDSDSYFYKKEGKEEERGRKRRRQRRRKSKAEEEEEGRGGGGRGRQRRRREGGREQRKEDKEAQICLTSVSHSCKGDMLQGRWLL